MVGITALRRLTPVPFDDVTCIFGLMTYLAIVQALEVTLAMRAQAKAPEVLEVSRLGSGVRSEFRFRKKTHKAAARAGFTR